MRRGIGPYVAVLLMVCATPGVAAAQSPLGDDIQIYGDEISFERARDLYEASGNVRIEQPGRVLTCDWLTVNTATQMGIAVGNVVIREGDDVLTADFAAVNVRTLEAVATNATLDSPVGFAATGQRLARTGENTYSVQAGTFSTCRCDPDDATKPWQIDVQDADIHVGGYAVARDATLKILDVPVLYSPWVILPVKTERQTGLLLPIYGSSSRNGSEFELPFFWAPRHDLGVLLRPEWLTKRGLKYAADIDYVFGEEGSGSGGAAAIFGDSEVEDNPLTEVYSDNRWAYWLRHEQPLAPGIRFGTDINEISDNNFPLDFEDLEDEARSARFLESQGYATFARAFGYAGAQVIGFDDLQSPTDLDRDSWLLQRLPELNASLLPIKIGPLPLRASLDADWIFFWRDKNDTTLAGMTPIAGQFFDTGSDGVFNNDEPNQAGFFPGTDVHADDFDALANPTGTQGNGLFEEGELKADQGQRLDVYPRLTLPFRLGPVEMLTEGGWRGTLYWPDIADSETRSLFTGRADARMRFVKGLDLLGRRVQHVLEPQLGFAYVSEDRDQRKNPLFVPESAVVQKRIEHGDLRNLLRDPSDRIPQTQRLEFSLNNRFFTPEPGRLAPRMLSSFQIGAGYDFDENDRTLMFTQATFAPSEDLELIANLGWDPEEYRVDESLLGVRWQSQRQFALKSSVSDRRHSMEFSYRFLRNIPLAFENFQREDGVYEDFETDLTKISQFNLRANMPVFRRLDVFVNGFWMTETSSSGGEFGIALLSACACWEVVSSIEQRLRPDETRFRIEVRLAGFGFEPINRAGIQTAAAGEPAVDGPRSVWESPAP